jgi:hypothetical protein
LLKLAFLFTYNVTSTISTEYIPFQVLKRASIKAFIKHKTVWIF